MLLPILATTQVTDEVTKFIRNQKYGANSTIDLYIDVNKHDVPQKFLDDIFTTLEYGLKSANYFGDINKREVIKKLDPGFSPYKCHYLGFYEVIDFKLDKINGQKHDFSIVAAFKIIDIFTGEIMAMTNINYRAMLPKYSEYMDLADIKLVGAFFKKNREQVGGLLKNKYPIVINIQSLAEVKKDKAKKVSLKKLSYMKSGNPDKMYVFRVKDQLEVADQAMYTFEYVGELKPSKSKGATNDDIILDVKDGDKKILQYFNAKETLYVSNQKFGTK